MHPDIAGADRSQQRIGQGVQPDIGIRMPNRRHLVRDRHAADHDMITWAEGMHVETLADANVALPRGEEPLGGGEVFGRRYFQIVLAAGDNQRGEPGRFGDRGIVGQHAAGGGTMRRQDRVEMKTLRGLRPPQPRPVDRLADKPILDPLDRVAQRQRRDCCWRPVEPVENPVDQRLVRKRPGAVMDQHPRRLALGQRFEAEPHRILSLRATGNRRQHGEAGGGLVENRAVLRPDHDEDTVHPWVRGKGRDHMSQDHAAAEVKILLRQRTAEAGAAAGGHDESIGRAHDVK